jgi:hypothetical protein
MGFGLLFECIAHEVDMHICSFVLYLLICILDLFLYVTQAHECEYLCLLYSDVVNYFLGH